MNRLHLKLTVVVILFILLGAIAGWNLGSLIIAIRNFISQ